MTWYAEGLRFECTQCGDCCTGAPGYVWVNKAEIQALAEAIGAESEAAFRADYVRKVGIRHSLKEHDNGDCFLLDPETRKCRAYQARPRQCRTWPFWDSNLKTPQAWAATCEVCPGSGQGTLYSLERIDEQRGVMRI